MFLQMMRYFRVGWPSQKEDEEKEDKKDVEEAN